MICQYNAERSLKAKSCGYRDFYAGKCEAFAEVLGLENYFKKMPVKAEKAEELSGTRD